MEALPLSPLADDLHDVPLARHARPLSGLPAIAASHRRGHRFLHRDPGKYRRDARRNHFWPTLEHSRTPAQPDRRAASFPGRHSAVGLRRITESAGGKRLGYSWALAGFEIFTIVVLAIAVALGPERRGRSFVEPARIVSPVSA